MTDEEARQLREWLAEVEARQAQASSLIEDYYSDEFLIETAIDGDIPKLIAALRAALTAINSVGKGD